MEKTLTAIDCFSNVTISSETVRVAALRDRRIAHTHARTHTHTNTHTTIQSFYSLSINSAVRFSSQRKESMY